MCFLKKICNLPKNSTELCKLIEFKKEEESRRYGGISQDLEVKDFRYLNEISFFSSEQFHKSLSIIHDIYVFDEKDQISVEEIQEKLNYLHYIFCGLISKNKI